MTKNQQVNVQVFTDFDGTLSLDGNVYVIERGMHDMLSFGLISF